MKIKQGDLLILSDKSQVGACVVRVGEYRRRSKAGNIHAFDVLAGGGRRLGACFEAMTAEVEPFVEGRPPQCRECRRVHWGGEVFLARPGRGEYFTCHDCREKVKFDECGVYKPRVD